MGGARIVESAADGGIVHTRDATCTTRRVSQRNCQLLHEVVTVLSVLFRGGLTLTPTRVSEVSTFGSHSMHASPAWIVIRRIVRPGLC